MFIDFQLKILAWLAGRFDLIFLERRRFQELSRPFGGLDLFDLSDEELTARADELIRRDELLESIEVSADSLFDDEEDPDVLRKHILERHGVDIDKMKPLEN